VQSSSVIPTAARSSIGWTWYDKPHYLVPDDKVGEEALSIIREAMVKSNVRAISRAVFYRRERAVLLEPRDKGMVPWTLRKERKSPRLAPTRKCKSQPG
jgi:DNA end-binding protein Ku